MAVIEVEVNVRVDGVPVDGFPLIRRLNPAQFGQRRYIKPNGDGVTYVQASQLATDNFVIVWTDSAIGVGINNKGPIPLNPGGFIIICDAQIVAGAATNVTVNNAGAGSANLLFSEGGP
jgi:hypothetical protein